MSTKSFMVAEKTPHQIQYIAIFETVQTSNSKSSQIKLQNKTINLLSYIFSSDAPGFFIHSFFLTFAICINSKGLVFFLWLVSLKSI